MADGSTPVPATAAAARSASAKDRLASLFPDADGPARRRHWYQRRGRLAVAGLVVVALVAGTAVVAGAVGSNTPDYRTAVVGTHLVDQQLTGVATIEPISQATVAFPVSGTVATVGVKTGDSVTVGQSLASLDTGALTMTLHTQQAALAQAQLVLADALAGKTTSGTGSAGAGSSTVGASLATGSGSTTPVAQSATLALTTTGPAAARTVAAAAPGGPTTPGGATAGTTAAPDAAQISAAQQAVLAAQKNVDAAIATANTALASAATICAAAGVSTTSSAHPTATTAPTTTTAPRSTASPSTAPTPEQLQACQTATQTVLTDQTAVSTAQAALATESNALDTLLGQAASGSATTTTTAPPTPSGGGSTSRSGSGAGSGAGTGSGSASTPRSATSTAPSAADLVKDQAAVDAAAAKVAVAQQAIDQAAIASPISGTVAAVNLKVGDAVSANSSTENVVIEGPGGYEVSTTVSVTDIPEVKVGQAATVLPDGSTRPLAGTVSSISVAPTPNASTTSYTVFIGLADSNAKLLNGATGTVSIVTGRAASVLAVPTSAVTISGTRHTVSVVRGGTATTTTVQVGVVGDTWTDIKGGLQAGETVALANLAKPLPGSATTATTAATTSRLGVVGGGTFPAGGFGGGGGFRGGATP